MKTALAMITIGPDSWTRRYSVARARDYAAQHGYDFLQITEPIVKNSGRTPHWEKVLIPRACPGYDRWLIIDDDVLINLRKAPPLPDLPVGHLGMVREPVPTRFKLPMEWLGNSGVLLLDREAVDLLESAYAMGEYKDIVPGYGDQPALNAVAWSQKRVFRLDWKWNYMLMADWLSDAYNQEYPWTKDVGLARRARVTLFAKLAVARFLPFLQVPAGERTMIRLRDCYFVHLIWFRMGASWIHRFLG